MNGEGGSDEGPTKGLPKVALALAVASASALGTLLIEKLSHHGAFLVAVICIASLITASVLLSRVIVSTRSANPILPYKKEPVYARRARVLAWISLGLLV